MRRILAKQSPNRLPSFRDSKARTRNKRISTPQTLAAPNLKPSVLLELFDQNASASERDAPASMPLEDLRLTVTHLTTQLAKISEQLKTYQDDGQSK